MRAEVICSRFLQVSIFSQYLDLLKAYLSRMFLIEQPYDDHIVLAHLKRTLTLVLTSHSPHPSPSPPVHTRYVQSNWSNSAYSQ